MSNPILLALIASNGTASPVIVTLGTITQTRIVLGQNPLVGMQFDNLGQQAKVTSGNQGGSPTYSSAGFTDNWLNIVKNASDSTWSVRVTETASDANWAWDALSEARGVFHNLSTTRNFFGSKTGGTTGNATATVDVEISNDGGTTIVDSVTGAVLTSRNGT